MECRPLTGFARDPGDAPVPAQVLGVAPRHAAEVIHGLNGRIERRDGGLRIEWPTMIDIDLSAVERMELFVVPDDGHIELFLRLCDPGSGARTEARILFDPEHEAALRVLREQIFHPDRGSVMTPALDEAVEQDSIMAVVHATGLAAPPVTEEFPDAAPPPAVHSRPLPRILPALDVVLATDDEAWISFAPLESTLDLILPPAGRDHEF